MELTWRRRRGECV